MAKILGLDIGIASVGYAVIDNEDNKIIESAVSLFSSATPDKNRERREARSSRRTLRRKKYRLKSIRDILKEKGFIENEECTNPYELRYKGLSERIDKSELANALIHIAKRRGISYLVDLEEDLSNADSVKMNEKLVQEKYPCEIQLERLNKYGQVRGHIESEEGVLSNIFSNKAYYDEAKAILENQSKYYEEIDEEFIEKILEIIRRKRPFYIGPGDEKNRTNYGVYRTDGKIWNNLFEHLIGKCSIYEDQNRAPASSYTAQEFNFLNDLNNLNLDGRKITKEEKNQVIKEVFNAKRPNIMNIVSKVTGIKKDSIKGFRIDRNNKPEFHNLKLERDLRTIFNNDKFNYSELSIKEKDELAYSISVSYDLGSLKKRFQGTRFSKLDDEVLNEIMEFRKKNTKYYGNWHSFSLKIMYELRDNLYNEAKNQMEILTQKGIKKQIKIDLDKYKYLPLDMFSDDIYNPVVKKSVRECIKIINALLKKYKEFEAIIIEMPRGSDDKEEEKKIQKDNEKNKKRVIKESGLTEAQVFSQKGLLTKLILLDQQDGKCIYSGSEISPKQLLNAPNEYEIDHIIPLSISLDDGLNNKVIVKSSCNQRKGQGTPYNYLNIYNDGISYDEYKEFVNKIFNDKKINNYKRDLLLFEEDINKYEVRQKFVSRNLNDTRYASRVILNGLNYYMKDKDMDTKIHVINGRFTSKLRGSWCLKKDRDESFAHHAIDAMVVAGSYMIGQSDATVRNPFLKQLEKDIYWKLKSNEEYRKEVYKQPWDGFNTDALSFPFKYSHKIDSKVNRQLSNLTIYSTRKFNNEEYIIDKYKNIYDNKVAKKLLDDIEEDLNERKQEESYILMRRYDIRTFEILLKIIEEYKDKSNPFSAYKEEHGYIRKYSKKGKGPIIKDIKYISSRLGVHMELKKGIESDRKIVLLSLKPFRSDIYYSKFENEYKVVGIKYDDFKFFEGKYLLDMEKYESKLKEKKIDDDFKFIYSFYENSIIGIKYKGEKEKIFRFLSNDEGTKNRINVKPLDKPKYSQRKDGLKTIGKKVDYIKKYSTDILGNIYQEQTKNSIKKIYILDNINSR